MRITELMARETDPVVQLRFQRHQERHQEVPAEEPAAPERTEGQEPPEEEMGAPEAAGEPPAAEDVPPSAPQGGARRQACAGRARKFFVLAAASVT